MKWELIIVLLSLVVSTTFVGCKSSKEATSTPPTVSHHPPTVRQETVPCPECHGAFASGSSIKCKRCDNTGIVGGSKSVSTGLGVQFSFGGQ